MIFSAPAAGIARRQRLERYRALRRELERLSDADLQDMGIKRYQLGHAARLRALG